MYDTGRPTCDGEVPGGRGDSLAVLHLALVRALVRLDDVADRQPDDAVCLVVVQLVPLRRAHLPSRDIFRS